MDASGDGRNVGQDLTEREIRVLEAVVRTYVETAEPAGSPGRERPDPMAGPEEPVRDPASREAERAGDDYGTLPVHICSSRRTAPGTRSTMSQEGVSRFT